jgi:hypothetical protein
MDLTEYDAGQADYLLRCIHCIGGNSTVYRMKCLVLKEMPHRNSRYAMTTAPAGQPPYPGRRFKILVFGERYWAGRDHIKRIRYVAEHRLMPIGDYRGTPLDMQIHNINLNTTRRVN